MRAAVLWRLDHYWRELCSESSGGIAAGLAAIRLSEATDRTASSSACASHNFLFNILHFAAPLPRLLLN